MSKLIIFGTGQLAEIAFYYFTKDSPYKIEAFVVDDNFVKENLFQNKPVIAFSDLNTNDFIFYKNYAILKLKVFFRRHPSWQAKKKSTPKK